VNRRPTQKYIDALMKERWGDVIPWRERTQRPVPPPPEDDLTKARRRRVLNEALDDAPQDYRRWQRTA
jgi:hypothetical protein